MLLRTGSKQQADRKRVQNGPCSPHAAVGSVTLFVWPVSAYRSERLFRVQLLRLPSRSGCLKVLLHRIRCRTAKRGTCERAFTLYYTVLQRQRRQQSVVLWKTLIIRSTSRHNKQKNKYNWTAQQTCFLVAPLACCEARLNQSGCRVCVCVCVCVWTFFFRPTLFSKLV